MIIIINSLIFIFYCGDALLHENSLCSVNFFVLADNCI